MCLLAGPVSAEDGCRSDTTRLSTRATVNVRIDNDMFGGMGQDQGYSNGFLVSAVSPNLADYTDDPCLPRPAVCSPAITANGAASPPTSNRLLWLMVESTVS